MKHFLSYQSGEDVVSSPEPSNRLQIRAAKHGDLLRTLNNRVWLVTGSRSGRGTEYRLQAVFVARSISETTPGALTLDGADDIEFDPPIILNDLPWFDQLRAERSLLKKGVNHIANQSIVDHLLDLEQRRQPSQKSRRSSASTARKAARKDEGQGKAASREPGLAQKENAAVQARAMASALEYYGLRWKNVVDVSSREAYDIYCDDPKGRILAVSVKGTTGGWENLLLSAAEERSARERYPDVALFVLHDISVVTTTDGDVVGQGGTTHVIDPWDITLDELTPLIFGCHLARSRSAKQGAR